MIKEIVKNLKFNFLSKEQYKNLKESGNVKQNEIYAVEEEDVEYAKQEDVDKLYEEKIDQTTFDGHVQNDNIHVTSEEKQTWNNKATTEYVDSEINDVKAQMVQQTPLFANSIEECTDTTKVYVLPDGYIYAYMYVEDNGIGENLWTFGDVQGTTTVKKYIDIPAGEYILKCKVASTDTDAINPISVVSFLNEAGISIVTEQFTRDVLIERSIVLSQDASSVVFYASYDYPSSTGDTINCTDVVIASTEVEAGYYWQSTGHAFVPTDYEDRIIALENEVDEIKEELEKVEKEEISNLFDDNVYKIINKNSDGLTTFGGYAGSTGLVSNDTYITYMFTAMENTSIYSVSTTSDYYSIVLFSGEPSANTFLARYRLSDNNIPTSETQVNITKGTIVAITIQRGASPNFEIAIAEKNVLSNDVKFNTYHKDEIVRIVDNKLILKKVGEELKINVPSKKGSGLYLQFGFVHDINSTANTNVYRLKSMHIVDKDFAVRHILKESTEIEGVVTENGANDYIGGYHGDETYEFCTVLVDGTEKPMNGEDYSIACDTLDIVVKSTINSVNNVADKVFTRYKHIVFNGNTLIIENKWIALRSVKITRSYMTMMSLPILSGDKYISKYCRNNISYSVQQTDGEEIAGSPFEETTGVNCIEMWSDTLYVKTESESKFADKTTITGFVSTEQVNTAKAYFMQYGAIEEGQQITGKSHYTFIV